MLVSTRASATVGLLSVDPWADAASPHGSPRVARQSTGLPRACHLCSCTPGPARADRTSPRAASASCSPISAAAAALEGSRGYALEGSRGYALERVDVLLES